MNLIGAEIFAIYPPDARSEMLESVAAEGVDAAPIPGCLNTAQGFINLLTS